MGKTETINALADNQNCPNMCCAVHIATSRMGIPPGSNDGTQHAKQDIIMHCFRDGGEVSNFDSGIYMT